MLRELVQPLNRRQQVRILLLHQHTNVERSQDVHSRQSSDPAKQHIRILRSACAFVLGFCRVNTCFVSRGALHVVACERKARHQRELCSVHCSLCTVDEDGEVVLVRLDRELAFV